MIGRKSILKDPKTVTPTYETHYALGNRKLPLLPE